jgi:NADH-quinone oxidoreductase subunit G
LRQAAKNGAKVSMLNATGDDSLIETAHRIVAAPSAWVDQLAGIAAAVAQTRGVALPAELAGAQASAEANDIAASLSAGERRVILLGTSAVRHPEFAKLHAAAQWIAQATGATLGFLPEAANTVGAHVVGALPGNGGLNAAQAFAEPRKAYLLFNVEPEFDTANPQAARAAVAHAEMVVVLSPFKTGTDYADVLLPVSAFSETAGTFINAEGTVQPFTGIVRPLGEARPGWKVLRVLGNLLGLPNFEYASAEEVAATALQGADVASRLSNATRAPLARGAQSARADGAFERIADVPIYHADPLVRRAQSLQLTTAAKAALRVSLPAALFDKLGLKEGDAVRVRQGDASVTLPAVRDAKLHDAVVRVPAATPAAAELGSLFGDLLVEKA